MTLTWRLPATSVCFTCICCSRQCCMVCWMNVPRAHPTYLLQCNAHRHTRLSPQRLLISANCFVDVPQAHTTAHHLVHACSMPFSMLPMMPLFARAVLAACAYLLMKAVVLSGVVGVLVAADGCVEGLIATVALAPIGGFCVAAWFVWHGCIAVSVHSGYAVVCPHPSRCHIPPVDVLVVHGGLYTCRGMLSRCLCQHTPQTYPDTASCTQLPQPWHPLHSPCRQCW